VINPYASPYNRSFCIRFFRGLCGNHVNTLLHARLSRGSGGIHARFEWKSSVIQPKCGLFERKTLTLDQFTQACSNFRPQTVLLRDRSESFGSRNYPNLMGEHIRGPFIYVSRADIFASKPVIFVCGRFIYAIHAYIYRSTKTATIHALRSPTRPEAPLARHESPLLASAAGHAPHKKDAF
jgi:hypothetical protein